MKKQLFLLFILLFVICSGCSREEPFDKEAFKKEVIEEYEKNQKNNENKNNENTQAGDKKEENEKEDKKKEDEYYVKYTATYISGDDRCYSLYYNEKYETVRVYGRNFEMVIGPVKKGFEAYLGGTPSNMMVHPQKKIEISKNGGVFMTKATGSNDISYIIDF